MTTVTEARRRPCLFSLWVASSLSTQTHYDSNQLTSRFTVCLCVQNMAAAYEMKTCKCHDFAEIASNGPKVCCCIECGVTIGQHAHVQCRVCDYIRCFGCAAVRMLTNISPEVKTRPLNAHRGPKPDGVYTPIKKPASDGDGNGGV